MRASRKKLLLEEYERIVLPIISSAEVHLMDGFVQHGTTSTLDHVMSVAWASLRLAHALRLPINREILVRAAMLHDYYLYDWHIPDPARPGLHGFTHGPTAAKNAKRDFNISKREEDAIYHHMFPLVTPPHHLEGWVLTFVDKYISTKEVFVDGKVAYLVPIKEKALAQRNAQ